MSILPDALHTWQNFYLLTGGASATLIGLLFVALSLGSHLVSDDSQKHLDAYVTPVLLYFVSVLIVACLMLLPDPSLLLVLGLTGLGLFGLARVGGIFIFMRRPNHVVALFHWFTHVVFPGSSYLLFTLGGLSLLVTNTSLSLLAVALGAMILLVAGIWHSWDLVLWVARQPRA